MINLISKGQCCGCSACLHICPKHSITFKEDSEGFLYPHVDISSCVDCGLCEKVCPVINQDSEREPITVYAAKHPDVSVRLKSSSGGLFTLLAEQIIDQGGVVFGAKFNNQWEVIHDYTETKEGLESFRGSKYVQSYIGNSYLYAESFLKSGRKVMFTGTPCQIAGLKKFLRREYENLLTVDLICHGVPSPKVWRMYLEEEIARKGDAGKNTVLSSSKVSPVITGVNFRDKSTGWKKYSFVLNISKATAAGDQNSVLSSIFTDNVYMRAFLSNLSLRPSCYECPAKGGKSGADITIGDFWGVEKILPEMNDDMGCSVIIVNKPVLLNVDFEKYAVKYNSVLRNNLCLKYSVPSMVNRKYFYNCILTNTFQRAWMMTTSNNIYYRIHRWLYRNLTKKGI